MSSEKGDVRKPQSRAGQPSKKQQNLLRLIIIGVAVLLVVGMAATTKWLTPEKRDELIPPPFSAATWASEEFPGISDTVVERAVDLNVLIPAMEEDESAAFSQYGVDSGGKFTVPVTVTAPVDAADENFIELKLDEFPKYTVRVAAGNTYNGVAVRDVTGEVSFGDFKDQTTFQQVANELKDVGLSEVIDPIDRGALSGKTITVYGAWVSGGPAETFIIHPVKVEIQE